MTTFILIILGAISLAVFYAQQRLYPHQRDIPPGWWILSTAGILGWWSMLSTQPSVSLPQTLFALGAAIGNPVAAFGQAFPSVLDIATLITGLVFAAATIRQHLWAWPAGAVLAIVLTGQALWEGSVTETGIQVYFIITQLYGWWYWQNYTKRIESQETLNHSGIHAPYLRLKHVSPFDLAFVGLVILALAYGYAWLTGSMGERDPAGVGLIVGTALVAQLLNARKHWAGWALWMLSNVIGIGYYANSGDAGMVLVSVLFLVVSTSGLYVWHNLARQQKRAGLESEIV